MDPDIVTIPAGPVELEGELIVPEGAQGIVLFAHGSGSSRHSPRNKKVAGGIQSACIATLLFDLLSVQEAMQRERVFDVEELAKRLCIATRWVRARKRTADLSVGYFGASTGAAAALIAAASDAAVRAVVSRGGRPDLAPTALARVLAPTLLIVGGDDLTVLRLNEQAYRRLRCEKALEIVPGAGHLFEEPGALDAVMRLATAWFERYLRGPEVGLSSCA